MGKQKKKPIEIPKNSVWFNMSVDIMPECYGPKCFDPQYGYGVDMQLDPLYDNGDYVFKCPNCGNSVHICTQVFQNDYIQKVKT